MKHSSQLERRHYAVMPGQGLPPPDPTTRVELIPAVEPSAAPATRRHAGELIAAAGLGALLVAVCSAFIDLVHLPPLSTVSVASLGGALMLLGALKHKQSRSSSPTPVADVRQPPTEVDLPSLTGQLSSVLTQLRRQYGVAYRTRTWIEEVLPGAGADFKTPQLARDLLAAAALDAGGIRADVAGIAATHSRDDIVATSSVLLDAMNNLLATCERPTDRSATRSSDPSLWPAAAC